MFRFSLFYHSTWFVYYYSRGLRSPKDPLRHSDQSYRYQSLTMMLLGLSKIFMIIDILSYIFFPFIIYWMIVLWHLSLFQWPNSKYTVFQDRINGTAIFLPFWFCQPTQQQTRSRRSAYASSDNKGDADCGNATTEEMNEDIDSGNLH